MSIDAIQDQAAPPLQRFEWFVPDSRRAWYLWAIFACVIAAIVAKAPDYRTVTPNYRDACRNWFDGRPIYSEGVHGFLYFPHAAILFAPFAYLPAPMGDVLWRLVSIGSLALTIRRLAALQTVASGSKLAGRATFALMSWLAIPPTIVSARNGQMNLMLAALTALAFIELGQRRWWLAAFWLCLGSAFKPLMIVPMAVAAVTYRPVFRPLAVGGAVLLVAPFFTQHPAYVCQQYQVCVQKLVLAGNPGWQNPGSDFFGLLWSMGYAAPLGLQTASRIAAGVFTVVVAWFVVRRGDQVRAAGIVLGLTACYLALFNPRMENNGFVVLAPTLAWLAADAFLDRRRAAAGWLMVAVSLGIAGSYEITRGHNFWLCPALTIVVWGYTIFEVIAGRRHKPLGEFALGALPPNIASKRRDGSGKSQGRHDGQVDSDRQPVADETLGERDGGDEIHHDMNLAKLTRQVNAAM
jgi:hypothetical protein